MSSENEVKVCKWAVPWKGIETGNVTENNVWCETFDNKPTPTKAKVIVTHGVSANGHDLRHETRFCTVPNSPEEQQRCQWFEPLSKGKPRTIVSLIMDAGDKSRQLQKNS